MFLCVCKKHKVTYTQLRVVICSKFTLLHTQLMSQGTVSKYRQMRAVTINNYG